ncbi:MAG: DUF2254 domain-containing protein [Theionarchaea archaeon]|nr:DUF2254 domain-containing protein [Theionarchaea archaeon]
MSKRRKFSLEKNSRYTYAIPFVFVIFIMVIFQLHNLYQTNNAYYILSTLVQSEAAILAIVITLSLVAVQLTASYYSPRVTQVFKNAPDLWVLVFLYIATMTFSLALLKIVNNCPTSNFESYISLSYFLGVFCFTSLIPYIYRLFYLLKPKTIIKKLSEKINIDNLVEKESQPDKKDSFGEEEIQPEENDEEDPLQPIVDIVRSSMVKYDSETFKYGLRTIRAKICNILKKKDIKKSEAEIISKKVYEKLHEIGRLAVGREDEYSVMEIITVIKEIGKAPIMVESEGMEPKDFEKVISEASSRIGFIGKAATEKGLVKSSHWAVMALGELGKISASKILNTAVENTLNYYWKIGKMIVEEGEKATFGKLSILGTLREIGMVTVKNGMENEAKNILKYLDKFVEIAITRMEKQDLENVLKEIMDFLMDLLKEPAVKNLKKLESTASKNLSETLRIVRDKKLDVDISDAERLLDQF